MTLRLGDTLIAGSGANQDLSNLTSQGKNIANWSSNVTNCITEIPQDIKVGLNNGGLFLKAGCKYCVPNGFEQDGVTPHFDFVTVNADTTSKAYGAGRTGCMVVWSTDHFEWNTIGSFHSGSTQPSGAWWVWYDTTTNKIKHYNGSTIVEGVSFPICMITENAGTGYDSTVKSIDQVFNGFGYIGSTKFLLPMKGVGTVGKNADGTYHTVAWEINQVYTETMSSAVSGTYWQGFDLLSDGSMVYFGTYTHRNIISPNKPNDFGVVWTNPINGYSYYIDNNGVVGTTPYIPIRFALQSLSSGSVTSWSVINNTFTALNYWDSPTISGWAMPSGKAISLTVGASGTTYTAPANGWFAAVCDPTSTSAYVALAQTNTSIGSGTIVVPDTSYVGTRTSICCSKGQSVSLYYGRMNITVLRFYYAEGEENV